MRRVFVLIIIIVSLIIWMPVSSQVPMGEGYYYFNKCQSMFIHPAGCSTHLSQYDNLARLMFQGMIPVFGDSIHLYMYAQIGVMFLLYIIIFLVLAKVTNDNLFSFFATLTFLSNHTGSFSMMATGNYQRFAQRIPNLIPIFISFLFLHKYLDKGKFSDLTLSILLFIVSVFFAHHSLFITPLFVIYVVVNFFNKKFSFRRMLVYLGIIVIFVGSSIILTKDDNLAPEGGFRDFITNTPKLIQKTALQIPNLLLPSNAIVSIAKNWPNTKISFPYTKVLESSFYLLLPIIYFSLKSRNTNSKLKILYVSSILVLPIICLLNLYAYGSGVPDPLKNFGEDRIYFIPSIFSSIIIGYILRLIYNSRSKFIKILSFIIIITILINNAILIKTDSKKLEPISNKMLSFINYTKLRTLNSSERILIIGPSHLLWPAEFSNKFTANKNLFFALDSSVNPLNIDLTNWDKVYSIDFNTKISKNEIIEKVIK